MTLLNRHPNLILTVALATAVMLSACSPSNPSSESGSTAADAAHYEDVITEALDTDPAKILPLVDSLQSHHVIPEYKATYYRAQASYKLGQELTAELYYKKALAGNELFNERPALYYYACDQLSTILTCKGEQHGSIDIATKGYAKAKDDHTEDGVQWGAVLLHDIGYCQMRLDRTREAEKNFHKAYDTLRELALRDSTYDHMNSWARVAYNILDAYTSMSNYEAGARWIPYAEEAINFMASHKECPPRVAGEYIGSLNTHKATIYVQTGHPREAEAAYQRFLQTSYAHTSFGIIDHSEYLMEAERWRERAKLSPTLDSIAKAWNMPLSMYYLCAYLAPSFKAYHKSGQHEQALQTAQKIVESLDSVNTYEQQHNAAELAIIYETQEKERQIAEQQSELNYQRMLAVIIALTLIVLFFAIFMYFRHRAALKLEEKNRELRQKNRELTVANARAEESARMKSNFIQQVSHEIRTPLNVLSGFTQVITTPGMQLDDATKQDISQRITENTARITSLVNKMLQLSESNSQAVIELSDDVTPAEIAAQAANDSDIAQAAHIHFDMHADDAAADVRLHTNQQQAARALVQLLDNAIKFTKQGDVTLSIATDDPAQVRFVVQDTGIGVPPYEAERIFDEFVQLDQYYDGTGIGLSVARSIARRLGGDITLDTSYHQGARFVMTLPVNS